MPPKSKVDQKKLESERLHEILKSMLNEDENKYCADCDAKQPRWASWNLGVFLCIRCAGLHRNLGVHISRVKSVSLDTWLPEQVQSMRVMGNAKAKAVYESLLPDSFRRPQNDQALEHFIRAKYDQKKYMMKGWVPPKVDVNDLPPLTEPIANKSTKKFVPLGEIKQPTPAQKKEDTLVDLFSAPAPSAPAHSQSADLFSLSQPTNAAPVQAKKSESSELDDLFGPIVSAPTNSQPPQTSNDLADGLASLNFGAPAQKQSTTDDIMSLFNKPANITAMSLAGQQPIMPNQLSDADQRPQFASFEQWAVRSPAMTSAMPAFKPAPHVPHSSSAAFDDLFATAQATFASAPPKPMPAATTAPVKNNAQTELESLFM